MAHKSLGKPRDTDTLGTTEGRIRSERTPGAHLTSAKGNRARERVGVTGSGGRGDRLVNPPPRLMNEEPLKNVSPAPTPHVVQIEPGGGDRSCFVCTAFPPLAQEKRKERSGARTERENANEDTLTKHIFPVCRHPGVVQNQDSVV
jgi:hypothetical protein